MQEGKQTGFPSFYEYINAFYTEIPGYFHCVLSGTDVKFSLYLSGIICMPAYMAFCPQQIYGTLLQL